MESVPHLSTQGQTFEKLHIQIDITCLDSDLEDGKFLRSFLGLSFGANNKLRANTGKKKIIF